MLDIVQVEDGKDMGFADSVVMKAGNVLSVQLGDLEYLPNFGSDLKFFIDSPTQFQNDSFKQYLVQRLSRYQINVADVTEILETLFTQYTFRVSDGNPNSGGLIR